MTGTQGTRGSQGSLESPGNRESNDNDGLAWPAKSTNQHPIRRVSQNRRSPNWTPLLLTHPLTLPRPTAHRRRSHAPETEAAPAPLAAATGDDGSAAVAPPRDRGRSASASPAPATPRRRPATVVRLRPAVEPGRTESPAGGAAFRAPAATRVGRTRGTPARQQRRPATSRWHPLEGQHPSRQPERRRPATAATAATQRLRRTQPLVAAMGQSPVLASRESES